MPPIDGLRARLSALRKHIPELPNESDVRDYNLIIRGFEEELGDPEISSFEILSNTLKPRFLMGGPAEAVFTDTKFCDKGLFTRQVEGLWEYLVDQKVLGVGPPRGPQASPSHSGEIHFHAPVTGSNNSTGQPEHSDGEL
jgi:hypothetical protein